MIEIHEAISKQKKSIMFLTSIAIAGTLMFRGQHVEAKPTYPIVNVVIDDLLQNYTQPAVKLNGHTMVPMRGIFETLGANIDWNPDTQTVTGTKGETTIILTIGEDIAYIDGVLTKLATKPVLLNGSTLVPLRFVSESLGAEVGWDPFTQTASISTDGSVQTQPSEVNQQGISKSGSGYTDVVSGIKIRHGNHTYGVADQKEYDAVMARVDRELAKLPNMQAFDGATYAEYYEQYLNGARWDGNLGNGSRENRGLKAAEDTLKSISSNPNITKEELYKVYNIAALASTVISNAKVEEGAAVYNAYHLINGRNDCDARAQWTSAMFDQAGYNTMIHAIPGDANVAVEIGGKWYALGGTTFKEVTPPTTTNSASSYYIHTHPTFK